MAKVTIGNSMIMEMHDSFTVAPSCLPKLNFVLPAPKEKTKKTSYHL